MIGMTNPFYTFTIPAPSSLGGQITVALPNGVSVVPQSNQQTTFTFQITANGTTGILPTTSSNEFNKKIDPEQEKVDAYDRAMRGVG